MKPLFFIILFIAGCQTTDTNKAIESDVRLHELNQLKLEYAAKSITASNAAISMAQPSPELSIARDFNNLALEYLSYPLTFEDERGMERFVGLLLDNNMEAISRMAEMRDQAKRYQEEIKVLESEKAELMHGVYQRSGEKEKEENREFWGGISDWFKRASVLVVIGGVLYLLAVAGLLPIIIRFIAVKAPKMAYKIFGLVHKEIVDGVVQGVGEHRKEKKVLVGSGDMAAKQELDRLDKNLSVAIQSPKHKDLIDEIRRNKNL